MSISRLIGLAAVGLTVVTGLNFIVMFLTEFSMRSLLASVGVFVISLITLGVLSHKLKAINKLVIATREVANGNLNVNIDRSKISKDEVGALTQNVCDFIDVTKNMVDDLSNVYTQYVEVGNMHFSINEGKYQNSFKEMISSINSVLHNVTESIEELATTMNAVSDGDFSKNIDVSLWAGEWAFIPTASNTLVINLQGVNTEVNAMIKAIAEKGDLSFQIDEAKYGGDWRKIMHGLNGINNAIYAPIQVIRISMNEMAKGNVDLTDIGSKIKESGCNADSSSYVGVFKEIMVAVDTAMATTRSYVDEIGEKLLHLSKGDLRTNIDREYLGSFDSIKQSVNAIAVTLQKTMSEISSASEQVLSGAKQISMSAMDLANGASEQASSVEELNSSIDVITQQINQNAENTLTANDLSHTSTSNAQQGNEAMTQMEEAMEKIKESSDNISKIVRTIQDIAFQTNLLALNANVEAARAGEHGRGFAVVADEVRTLAGRSQTAVTETTSLIQDSISRVEAGTRIAEATAESLDAIVVSADEVMAVISSISAASIEQAEAITHISDGINRISGVVQRNSSVSEETAAAAEELNSQAEILQQLVSYFRL